MRRIDQDISSGQFHNIYLLYGKERYLIHQYTNKLKAALCAEGDNMNVHFYQGKGLIVEQIIDLAETLPFLAEHRVIFIDDCGLFKAGGDKLAAYLEEACESTIFVFTDFEIDSKCKSKLFKTVSSKGLCIEFPTQDDRTLFRWVASRIKKEGKQISEQTLQLFLSKNTSDMQSIEMELEKLFCYCLNKPSIEAADVEAICQTSITDNVFDLVEALGYGNHKKALEIYYELITAKEEPLRILSMISRQFHFLLQTKALLNKGFQGPALASKLGLSPYVAKKYVAQCKGFSIATLRQAMEQCVEAETAVKTGQLAPNVSVEMVLLTIGNAGDS